MLKNNKNRDESNRQSLIKLNKKDHTVIPSNMEFFNEENMILYGEQEFDLLSNEGKKYLKVDRKLTQSLYELDEDSKIVRITQTIPKLKLTENKK